MKAVGKVLAICAALLLPAGFSAAHAASSSGRCTNLPQTDFINSDADDATTSTAWQDITDGYRNFVQASDGCAIITVSGPVRSGTSTTTGVLEMRTLLDGTAICVPPDFNDGLTQSFGAFSTSITRICEHVAAGPHTIQVQYHSSNGQTVELLSHVLTVAHF